MANTGIFVISISVVPINRIIASRDGEAERDIETKYDTVLNTGIDIVNHCLLSSHCVRAGRKKPNNTDSKSTASIVTEETELPLLPLSEWSIYQARAVL